MSDIDLPKILLDEVISLTNENDISASLTPLLELGEVQSLLLSEPKLQLRGALAILERQKSLRRCKHLIDAWSSQRLETLENCISSLIEQDTDESNSSIEMETRIIGMFNELNSDALKFQDLYYLERNHLFHLDKQRCSNFTDDSVLSPK